jgi:uncharacterized membrane protein
MNNFYSGHMFGWGFDGGIMMLIFWVAAILLIVWAVQSFAGKRYAKGEINKEEFEAKKLAITNAN